MTALVARRTRRGWRVRVTRTPGRQITDLWLAVQRGRRKIWQLAHSLRPDCSPWELEYQKAAIGGAEISLGYAQILADRCEAAGESYESPSLSSAYACKRCADGELVRRGLARTGPLDWRAWADRSRFCGAALVALAGLVAYAVQRGLHRQRSVSEVCSLRATAFALHGESATRTQHLLRCVSDTAPACIVLLGRLRTPPSVIASEWKAVTDGSLPPLVQPFSLGAVLLALPRMASLLCRGLTDIPQQAYVPRFREQVAIAYRVLLGAASHQWWLANGPALGTVIFGHTGTADTMQLESAMKSRGTRTVHAVHGLALGPNFNSFSDAALFRCGFDADQYSALGSYRECLVQEAPIPSRTRGAEGLYLLTNLAHPMNPGYLARGMEDELALLRLVAHAARILRPSGLKMIWRPHPVITRLPAGEVQELRLQALSLGFEEEAPGASMAETAAAVRWIVASPSTTAVDLLASGALCLVVDVQQSAQDTAPGCFPAARPEPSALAEVLRELDDEHAYAERFLQTWNRVRPGRRLDAAGVAALASPLE